MAGRKRVNHTCFGLLVSLHSLQSHYFFFVKGFGIFLNGLFGTGVGSTVSV